MSWAWEHTLLVTLLASGIAGACAYAVARHTNKTHGERVLSLWLVPPEPVRTQLRSMMQAIVASEGTPMFEPHVTIIGNVGGMSDVAILRKLKQLQGTGKISVHFDTPVVSGRNLGEPAPWNQAVVAVVQESDALRILQEKAKSVFFGGTPTVAWAPPIAKPHLSLAYVESTLADDRSAKVCAAMKTPADFEAAELVVAQVSVHGEADVWPACLRNEWVEVARVKL